MGGSHPKLLQSVEFVTRQCACMGAVRACAQRVWICPRSRKRLPQVAGTRCKCRRHSPSVGPRLETPTAARGCCRGLSARKLVGPDPYPLVRRGTDGSSDLIFATELDAKM